MGGFKLPAINFAWALLVLPFLNSMAFAQMVKVESPKPMVTLPDQFERPRDIAQFQGNVLVLLYGDRTGISASKGFGEKLQVHYHPTAKGLTPSDASKAPVSRLPDLKEGQRSPDVKVLPVACLGNSTAIVKNIVRNRVKKEAGESMVLLDFEDKMKRQFGMKDSVPNLVVIDASGRVRMKLAGELDSANYAKLLETIDALRMEAAGQR